MEEGKPSIERIKVPNELEKILLREIRGVSIEGLQVEERKSL